LQSDLEELLGSSVKPFIDFDYTGQAAAADPKRFVWKPGEGVFLALEWTRSGRQAVEGKGTTAISRRPSRSTLKASFKAFLLTVQ
jgi:hypothetical protein